MDKETMEKFYELYLDMLQDTRTDAQTNAKFNLLMDILFTNVKLNWSKDGLVLKNDDIIDAILKGFNTERYIFRLNALQGKNKEEEE